MKYLVMMMLAISLLLACTDTNDASRKKYIYSVVIGHTVAVCQNYFTNNGSEMGGVLQNCEAHNGSTHIAEIRNAINVIVEEVK